MKRVLQFLAEYIDPNVVERKIWPINNAFLEIYESDRPVAHHITNISNVNFNPLPTVERKASLPGVLATDQAKIYWERLKQKKFVDGRFMLAQSTTRQQAAYIAEAFAEKLEIKAKWKTFQDFWGIKNLAQEIYQMKQIGKLPSRSKEIDAIFKDESTT